MKDKSDTVDQRIDEIAARQHGAITLRQLEDVGVGGRRGAAKRAKRGRLHRVHQGVYAVGHRGLSLHGCFMAAVLACGEGAVLSHGSATVLWGLLKPLDGPVHVSVPTTSGRKRRPGIHLHRCQGLLTTRRDNIPVTTVARTIEDLRRTPLPSRLVRRAIRQAELAGHRLDGLESDRTRSDLETYFLDLCRRHRLPAPEVNVKLRTRDLGSRSPGGGSPGTQHGAEPKAFEAPADYVALGGGAPGDPPPGLPDRQLEEEPGRVAADVARALA
ncbi:MAG TPA: type IV toxin-antitoxin system AbiEi family antitoxin domain-containing protein [Solirubrobacterales bacterium]|nr:type IV toxin-antitoxin system AbiEi family antitoxin domain-containing protein [Solirubrobacterales bacterium]